MGWCRDNGFAAFDLGVGDQGYKLEVGAEAVPLYRREQAETLMGHSYLQAQALRENLSNGPLGDYWRILKREWHQRKNVAAML